MCSCKQQLANKASHLPWQGEMTSPPPLFTVIVGTKGPQRARSARTRPKAARASEARPLYLKLLTGQTRL